MTPTIRAATAGLFTVALAALFAVPADAATRQKTKVKVTAPYTIVEANDDRVRVRAPYTRVAVDEGRVRVRAPYVDIDIRW